MRIEVHRHRNLAVSEQLHYNPRVNALRQQQGCGGMAEVMNSDSWQLRGGPDLIERAL